MKILAMTPMHSGVKHYRTDSPHKAMERKGLAHVDYHYDYKTPLSLDKLKEYDIVHFHTAFVDEGMMASAVRELNMAGTYVIMDLDDYWVLPKTHMHYIRFKDSRQGEIIENNLTLANHITTTSEYLAGKIRRYNRNVSVIPNAIDFSEGQWARGSERVGSDRFMYGLITGSSHKNDVAMLEGLTNRMKSAFGNSVGTVLCGYDLKGKTTVATYMNKDLAEDLKMVGMFNANIEKSIALAKGDLSKIKGFPKYLAEKYGILKLNAYELPIPPKDNVWYYYETVLTDGFRSIDDREYVSALHEFVPTDSFGDLSHIRIFSKDLKTYGEGYKYLDLPLAPLVDDEMNRCKSSLKALEAGACGRTLVCSEVEPYMSKDFDGCIERIPNGANQDKKWFKAISRLAKSKELRDDMAGRLSEVVRSKYSADAMADYRMEVYHNVLSSKKAIS